MTGRGLYMQETTYLLIVIDKIYWPKNWRWDFNIFSQFLLLIERELHQQETIFLGGEGVGGGGGGE